MDIGKAETSPQLQDANPALYPHTLGLTGDRPWDSAPPQSTLNTVSRGTTPGSPDLNAPYDAGSQPGQRGRTNQGLHILGPVSGAGTTYQNRRSVLRAPQAGAHGPITGGDYGTGLEAANRQARQLSQDAIASALVSAV